MQHGDPVSSHRAHPAPHRAHAAPMATIQPPLLSQGLLSFSIKLTKLLRRACPYKNKVSGSLLRGLGWVCPAGRGVPPCSTALGTVWSLCKAQQGGCVGPLGSSFWARAVSIQMSPKSLFFFF